MMRNTTTGRLMLMVALLAGVFMATATLRALAVEPPAQESTLATATTEPDMNNPDMPPLETGAPSGPIVIAKESDLEINSTDSQSAANAPTITVWYGTNKTFGTNGDPQKWINIMGKVSSGPAIASLTYSLNGGPAQPLGMGDDKRRLVQAGDFNIELDYTDLVIGANQVVIKATDVNAAFTEVPVAIQYTDGANSWPAQTYTYSWQGLSAISEKAQIVDGQWAIVNDTIRPTVFDFDRLVAIGDLSWKDYTVTVPITVDGIDEAGFGGASNGPGIGMMVRWQGHFDTGEGIQPRLGWRRLGALGWYRWQKDAQDNVISGFQLLGHGGTKLVEDARPLVFGTEYIFKINVQSNPDPTKPATYRFKVWEAAGQEPVDWQMVSAGNSGEPKNGSLLLVAHHVDASFGTVTVDLNSVASAPTLTANTSGTGSGTVGVVPNKTTFRFGEDAALTASAAGGSTFASWTGNVTGSEVNGNQANVSMFGNRTITAIFNDPNVVTPVSDDFSACELDTALWTYTDPLGDSVMEMTGSQLQIIVPAGASHDYWTTGTQAPRIMQFAEDDDFEIQAKFESPFSLKTQMQGLLVEGGSGNWLRFNVQHDGNKYRMFAATYVGSTLTTRADIKNLTLNAPIYLRINRTVDTWTLAYSSDGQNWTDAGSFSQTMSVTGVGVFAGNVANNNNAPETTVLVDYFFNTDNPINPEDGNAIALQTAVQGSGSIVKNPNKPSYACGEEVDLTATPAAGWKFVEWTGAVTGTDPQTSIVMNKSESVTAVFAPDTQYILTLTANGNGTVTADPPGPAYGLGEQVMLTATADIGHEFTGWTGDLIDTTNPVTITISSNRNITGNFAAAPNRTLNTSVPGGGGTIVADPAQTEFLNGETVELTAQPSAGMSFVSWGGALAGETDNPIDLVMDSDKSVTAQFATNVHSLTVTRDPIQGGTVTVNPVKPLYYNGETVELSVAPANGFVFLGWEGDLTGADNPATLVMSKNSTVTAKFTTTAEFTLNTIADGPGQITKDPDTGPYSFGETVTLTATADTGFAFIGWSGSLSGTTNPAVITMTENAVVTGTFTQDSLYTLDITAIGNGTVTRSPDKASYAQNEPVLLTAVPQLGHQFVGWTGGLTGTTNPTTIIMTKNEVISATFLEAEPVSLTIAVDPLGTGTVTVDPVKAEYLAGEIVTLTAKSLSGYAFSGWQGDVSGNTSPYKLTLDTDKSVVATFTNQSPQVSDDFNTCEINEVWEWFDPLGAADYSLNGTQVRMTIPEGENYNVNGTGGNSAARLMQPARNTNFSSEVKFQSGLSQQYQYQGILIEQDAANFIYFQFYSDGNGVKAYAGTVVNNVGSTRVNEVVTVGSEMSLRVRRTGDSWKLDYSPDGMTWTKVGPNFKHVLEVQSAGVFAGSHGRVGSEPPGHTAVVDFYFNSDSPIVPEDAAPPAINVTIVGLGTVGRVPDKPNYLCGEQVTLNATPNSGWQFAGWSGDVGGTNPTQPVTVSGTMDVIATFIQQGTSAFKAYLPAILR